MAMAVTDRSRGLLALIVAHVVIALKHHLIDKDNILRRMLTGN